MAKAIIAKCESSGDYCEQITLKVEGKERFAREMCNKFLEQYAREPDAIVRNTAVKVGELEQRQPGAKEEVVAIYDNAGIPSFMYRFTKKKNSELFPGGNEKTHSAFIIGGVEYDEIFVSVYPNCEINGKPYSLPYMEPWTDITNDEAAKACFSKGDGWHLMTRQEWGLLANICLKNNTLPHGNTNYGKYHDDEDEKGEPTGKYSITKTGSGPASWTHNHRPDGIHDLCGNVWEMVRGFRIRNGVFQVAKDNDAAMDIDLTKDGGCWKDVVDDKGMPIYASVDSGEIILTTDSEFSQGYDGDEWENVTIDCESEQLKELALYGGEGKAYFYVDSTDEEYLPVCGGRWLSGSSAGVFHVNLSGSRAYSSGIIGFRSAFYRRLDTE